MQDYSINELIEKISADTQQLCLYEKLLVGLAEAVEDWGI